MEVLKKNSNLKDNVGVDAKVAVDDPSLI